MKGYFNFQATQGRTLEELKEILTLINESVAEETMVNDGDEISVSIAKKRDGFSWIMNQLSGINGIVKRRFGEDMESLLNAIDGQVEDITEEFADWSLLVYRGDMEPFVGEDGKAYATFWELLPGDSLHVKHGQPYFRERKMREKSEQLKLFADSGIVFRKDDIFYLISEEALPQIGGILDCSSIMRKKSTETGYLLGLALLMSDKLDESKGLRFKTIEIGSKVRMILSCFSKTRDSGKSSMQRTLEDAIDHMKSNFNKDDIDKWELDERLTLNVFFETKKTPDYTMGIRLSCGEARGVPVKVQAYASFDEMIIALATSSGQKGSKLGSMFKDVVPSMKDFERTWEEVKQVSVVCTEALFGRIPSSDCLGAKRSKALFQKIGHTYLAKALFLEVLKETYEDLPEKQMNNLQAEYWTFLKNCLYAARASKNPTESETA